MTEEEARHGTLASRRHFIRSAAGLAAVAASVGRPAGGLQAAERSAGAEAAAGPTEQVPWSRQGLTAARKPSVAQAPSIPARFSDPQERLTISSVDAYPVSLHEGTEGLFEPPDFTSDEDPRRWNWGGPFSQLDSAIIAVVKTGEGIIGFGMGAGGSAATEIIHGHLRHLLVGANALAVERLWDQMYSAGLYYGRRGVFAMALSALDNALWDIAGRHTGEPVHQMIGGLPRERIAIYQSGGRIQEGLERGIRHFKGFVPGSPNTRPADLDRAVDRVLQARDTMGPNGNLMIDCGSRSGTVEWALDLAERLRPADLYFMEELLSPDNVFGYADLVRRIGGQGPGWTRVACGEHEYTHHGFDVLIRLGSAEVLQPDVTWCGGLTAGIRIARLVEEAGLELSPHRGGSLWGLPLALSSPSCVMAESFAEGSALLEAMTPRSQGGYYLASADPGFGTKLNETMVLDHRLKPR